MEFEQLFDSLENVPPELERNFTLIRELDDRTKEVMERIDECIIQYEASNSRSDRSKIQSETDSLFEKIFSYADDKAQLSLQTYELIDKNIKRLTNLGNQSVDADDEHETTPAQPIGYDMPCDPNEPRYCICDRVSFGEMIACENKECEIEWFHMECLGFKSAPRGDWYCGNCLPKVKEQHRKKANAKRRRR